MKQPITIPAEHVKHIQINKMSGRMVHIENPSSNKVIIYIHGLHTSAERHYSACQFLSDFGTVYAPDMPGFGGMTSFYNVGMQPSYDTFADYIYTFIKSLNISKDKQIILFGLSFGSQVMTRLLQKYPDLQSQTKQAISFVGTGAGSDFKDLKLFKSYMYPIFYLGSKKYSSKVLRLLFLNPISLRMIIGGFLFTKPKLTNDEVNSRSDIYKMEYILWRTGDIRTHATSAFMMFRDDLRKYSKTAIQTPLHNVSVDGDQYFDTARVDETLGRLYANYEREVLSFKAHAPSLLVDKESVAALFPPKTIKRLS